MLFLLRWYFYGTPYPVICLYTNKGGSVMIEATLVELAKAGETEFFISSGESLLKKGELET